MMDPMPHYNVHFMVVLMLHLKVHLRVHFKEPLKMYKKDVIYVAVDGALEGAFVNAIEDTTVG